MHPAFKIYENATPELIQFLEGTILGSNGAQYEHLDTLKRIKELDNPLHLSLIRNEKIIANITFCRREKDWYIRYFAFDRIFHSSNSPKASGRNSMLKNELKQFFNEKLESGEVNCFYAYIDPKNERSSEFAAELGFIKNDTFQTQTFSRLKPKLTNRLKIVDKEDDKIQDVLKKFSNETFYHNVTSFDQFYGLFSDDKSLIAFASINRLHWKIHRLPGRFGKTLTKSIPYFPFLRKIINPKQHQFVGVDHVWALGNNPEVLQELFENILAIEKKNLAVWWVDSRLNHFDKIKWGLAHTFVGSNPVDLYVLNSTKLALSEPYFLITTDFS